MTTEPNMPVRRPSAGDAAALEQFLVKLWGQVLSREGIGRDDNFFALGGRSFHAIMMINRLQEAIGVEIPVTLIFETQTIAEFVRALTDQEDEFVL
jgi:acyl carrier protein